MEAHFTGNNATASTLGALTAYAVYKLTFNAVAGAKTIYSGKYHSTIGAAALADLTGINPETAELIYSSPSMVFGVKSKYDKSVIATDTKAMVLADDVGNLGVNNSSYLSDLLPRERAKDFILPTGRQSLDPTTVSFSQGSVSYGKVGKDYNFDTLVESMKKDGWKGDPIDVVNMSDGAPTSLDNTRVLAARQAGVKVEATVHNYNDKLTAFDSIRFSHNGVKPTTWGEAVLIRLQRQAGMQGVPEGWNSKNPNGTLHDPNIIR
ncbi:hypothetical protein Q7469_09280 [Glaesserella parasuis]|uniref:hypothetical protein n=1 Tax=Glaesserella parasuis TaxID=738 RepID=UPI000A9EDB0C|nr:hypothetical protein [Glaesserella parasuis]MDG6346461.1 hypothetical protein [Glaesserella parasuis]MDG6772156.1 hypothetical protein [Glaesserella parasuis]MDO9874212.1 hypothetical protein [Glaesserella parasuis]MDO9913917.1 hypothetical protein [Glaesserella parasuis]MDP0351219.1 hypothetical protein [Glaesserella parasuis]